MNIKQTVGTVFRTLPVFKKLVNTARKSSVLVDNTTAFSVAYDYQGIADYDEISLIVFDSNTIRPAPPILARGVLQDGEVVLYADGTAGVDSRVVTATISLVNETITLNVFSDAGVANPTRGNLYLNKRTL